MVPEILEKVCITTRFRGKTFFAPKIGEMGQKWLKKGFLHLKKSYVIDFQCIYSILKIFICCIPAQVL